MMVCGLSREVTLAVLPRLYVEELILELGRRNIHPVTDSSSREDLISLLCDVMIEEYSRGRRAACVTVPREPTTTAAAVTRRRQASGNTTAVPAPKRSTTGIERERRSSGQADSSSGKQTSTSETARSVPVPVRETPPAKDDTGDVIVVEDDEPELAEGAGNGRQEDAPRTGVPTGPTVRTHQHSRPQQSPGQRGRHSKGPSACNTPDACSGTSIQRVLSPQENIRMDTGVQRNSRGVESTSGRDMTAPESREVNKGTTVQPDSSLNSSQPEEGPGTDASTSMEANNYAEVDSVPSVMTDSTPVQETSVAEADGLEVIMDSSSNFTEESSHDTGQKDTRGAVRPVENLAMRAQEFVDSDSARPPGYLQTLPGTSTSLSDPVFQSSNTETTTTYPILLEALGTEGSSSNDSLLGTQQPTCMVKTSEEAMAIWQNLSERNSTPGSATATVKSKRGRKKSTWNTQHACQECGYKAPSNSALIIHMRKHTGEKPFSCDLCGYRTAYKAALVAHTMTHNGDKPYMCGECGYRTVQKTHLKKHMTTHMHNEYHVHAVEKEQT